MNARIIHERQGLVLVENEFLFDVVEEYFKVHNQGPCKWNFHTFWYWKNIPDKRLREAKKYFAPYNEELEKPLLLMSDNTFGKLFRGILVTNIKLYYFLNRNDSLRLLPETKHKILSLGALYDIQIEPKKYGAWFLVNGQREAYIAGYSIGIVDEKEAIPFKNAVNHILYALHEKKLE